MEIIQYIATRLGQMVPVLFLVALISFFSMALVPGDPIMLMLGGRATETVIAAAHEEFGLDKPIVVRFFSFIFQGLQGDLGRSIIQRQPVTVLIGERISQTSFLLGYSAFLALVIAIPFSFLAVIKHNRPTDHIIRLSGMIGLSMPSFWVGLLLMLLFGLKLNLFPIRGFGDGFLEHLWYLFLPSFTISLFLMPMLVQSLRESMLDVLQSDYIEVARSKGLSSRRILLKHVFRNSLIPTITVLSVNIGWLLSGAVVVEFVFSIPGLGSLLVRSVGFRDYPVIQGLAVVFAMMVMMVNLLADLLYMVVDRRVIKKQ